RASRARPKPSREPRYCISASGIVRPRPVVRRGRRLVDTPVELPTPHLQRLPDLEDVVHSEHVRAGLSTEQRCSDRTAQASLGRALIEVGDERLAARTGGYGDAQLPELTQASEQFEAVTCVLRETKARIEDQPSLCHSCLHCPLFR